MVKTTERPVDVPRFLGAHDVAPNLRQDSDPAHKNFRLKVAIPSFMFPEARLTAGFTIVFSIVQINQKVAFRQHIFFASSSGIGCPQ